jgi:hypothetical protein
MQWTDPALAEALWGDNADPDGDGASNLHEYVFGTDPLSANPGDATPLSVTPGQDPGTILVSYRRRTDDATLSYALEASGDFTNWEEVQSTAFIHQSSVNVGGGAEQLTIQLAVAVTPANAEFLRIRVSLAP